MPSILSNLRLLAVCLLVLSSSLSSAQTQINPASQIRWPAITGAVDPVSPTWPCTTVNYGQPYTNTLTGVVFSCSALGWTAVGTVFTIVSFGGGSTVEVGSTVTNPAFTASYSHTPTSAQITNTDSIDSPHALSTPFTTATVTGAFLKHAAGTTVFTLSATYSSVQTATQNISWVARTFGGVGTSGATGATASSVNATLTGATGTLANGGLGNQTVYGPYNPASQKVYILMTGGAHTFKDAVTGFTFVFNTPTAISFTNQNGDAVSMFLYESTNTLSGIYSVQVVS
jgi:hypothetical protein